MDRRVDATGGDNLPKVEAQGNLDVAAERLALGEDAFRRLVEWAPTAMMLVDAAGRIVLVNAQAERLFGYARAELVGFSVEQLLPERFARHHPELRETYLASAGPRPMGANRDLFARRHDGSEVPVEIGLNPIDTGNGKMVLASIVDITERRRNQQVLENALREKTALLNEVHHRVKNNLQVISSLLNLQASHTSDERLRAILQESQGRVKAMALTHQLLYEGKDFSRLDLRDFLGRLVQLLRGAYRVAGRIGLRLELPDAPIHVDLERAVPCALLINELATNAFKHAFPGERSGEVVIALNPLEAGAVELSVVDDGIGLPAGFSLDSVTSLGLQLVPLFVDQLQGVLHIGPGPGTRFALRFTIPAADEGGT